MAVATPPSRVVVLILAVAEACKVEAVASKEVDSPKTLDAVISNSAVARVVP